jgi:hypothetical protein
MMSGKITSHTTLHVPHLQCCRRCRARGARFERCTELPAYPIATVNKLFGARQQLEGDNFLLADHEDMAA